MSVSQDQLYTLIGTAVIASQQFEVIFVLAAKLALKQDNVAVIEDVVPVSQTKSFRQPIAALLKEIRKVRELDPGISARIAALTNDRHRVVHRLALEFGWPVADERSDELPACHV